MINLEKYPIHDQQSPLYEAALQKARSALRRDGCAILKGFLTTDGINCCVAEAESVIDHAHRSFSKTNPYFTQGNRMNNKAVDKAVKGVNQ